MYDWLKRFGASYCNKITGTCMIQVIFTASVEQAVRREKQSNPTKVHDFWWGGPLVEPSRLVLLSAVDNNLRRTTQITRVIKVFHSIWNVIWAKARNYYFILYGKNQGTTRTHVAVNNLSRLVSKSISSANSGQSLFYLFCTFHNGLRYDWINIFLKNAITTDIETTSTWTWIISL